MHLGKNVFESKVRERKARVLEIVGDCVNLSMFVQDLARRKKEKG